MNCQPWLVCAITSLVAIPIWFVGLVTVVSSIKPIDNPAGIPVYMMMCFIASVFVVPVNTKIIAPMLAGLASRSAAKATIVHLVVGGASLGILWAWPSIIGKMPSLAWTIILFYLAIFFVPPLLVGSFAYSIQNVVQNRRIGTNNPMDRSGGSAAS